VPASLLNSESELGAPGEAVEITVPADAEGQEEAPLGISGRRK